MPPFVEQAPCHRRRPEIPRFSGGPPLRAPFRRWHLRDMLRPAFPGQPLQALRRTVSPETPCLRSTTPTSTASPAAGPSDSGLNQFRRGNQRGLMCAKRREANGTPLRFAGPGRRPVAHHASPVQNTITFPGSSQHICWPCTARAYPIRARLACQPGCRSPYPTASHRAGFVLGWGLCGVRARVPVRHPIQPCGARWCEALLARR